MTATYPRCLVCGGEPAPILDDRPEAYNQFGRHAGACYCLRHPPAGVPTVEIVPDAFGVRFVTRDAKGLIVQDDRPWQLREGGIVLPGQQLRVRREALGLNRAEFARRLGRRWETIWRWEEGRRPVPASIEPALQRLEAEHVPF